MTDDGKPAERRLEAHSRKPWSDPGLVEFDVDRETAISPEPTEDGMGGGS